MQKIGICKGENKVLRYYNKNCQSIFMSINEGKLNKIYSNIINVNIENMEFLNNATCIKILLKANITILYNNNDCNNLYSIEKSFLTVSYINVPKIIEGISSHKLFLQNKFKTNIFVENISCQIINEKDLILSFYIINNIYVNPSFYFAYIMDNGLFENVYSSFYNGENMIQITKENNLKFKNLLWDLNKNNLFFISYNNSYSYLNAYNFTNKHLELLINKNINNFTIFNNNIIFERKENEKSLLYTFNINNHNIKVLNIPFCCDSFIKPYYDNISKKLYFLALINNIYCLTSFNFNDSFEILFDAKNVENYVINGLCKKAILKIFFNDKDTLFILDLNSKILTPLNLNFNYDSICKFDFYKDENSKESIFVLIKENNTFFLLNYDLNNFATKSIYTHKYICDFYVDINNYSIIVCVKNQNYYEIVEITNNKYKSLMKTPNNISEICIKR